MKTSGKIKGLIALVLALCACIYLLSASSGTDSSRTGHSIEEQAINVNVEEQAIDVNVGPQKKLRQITTREELGTLAQELEDGYVGVELGVQEGIFSNEILKRWKKCRRFYLIDSWRMLAEYHDLANQDDQKQVDKMMETVLRLLPYGNKTITIRTSIEVAAEFFKPASVDFVYVDARHDYPSVLEDMSLFWPFLKPGGIMAGHDFLDQDDLERIGSDQKWNIGPDGTNYGKKAVKSAVLEFAESKGRVVHVTQEPVWKSWYFSK